jgi:hypothetical protein
MSDEVEERYIMNGLDKQTVCRRVDFKPNKYSVDLGRCVGQYDIRVRRSEDSLQAFTSQYKVLARYMMI